MEKEEKKLTIREKIVLWILLLMIKITKPSQYSHEYQKEIDEIKKLIEEE